MLLGAWHLGLAGVVWALVVAQLVNCVLCYRAVRTEAGRFQIPIRLNSTAADRRLFWSFSVPAGAVWLGQQHRGWGASAMVSEQKSAATPIWAFISGAQE